jgi:hypothetical protein
MEGDKRLSIQGFLQLRHWDLRKIRKIVITLFAECFLGARRSTQCSAAQLLEGCAYP